MVTFEKPVTLTEILATASAFDITAVKSASMPVAVALKTADVGSVS